MLASNFLAIILQIILLVLCALFKRAVFWYVLLAYSITLGFVAVFNNWSGLTYPFILGFGILALIRSLKYVFEGEIL